MATPTSLLDLPQEILVMILEEHFATTNVHVLYHTLIAQPNKQSYLSICQACKPLANLALPLAYKHATFHYRVFDQGLSEIFKLNNHTQFVETISGISNFAAQLSNARPNMVDLFPKLKHFVWDDDMMDSRSVARELEKMKVVKAEFEAQQVGFSGLITAESWDWDEGRDREERTYIKLEWKACGSICVCETFGLSFRLFNRVKDGVDKILGTDLARPPSEAFDGGLWKRTD